MPRMSLAVFVPCYVLPSYLSDQVIVFALGKTKSDQLIAFVFSQAKAITLKITFLSLDKKGGRT